MIVTLKCSSSINLDGDLNVGFVSMYKSVCDKLLLGLEKFIKILKVREQKHQRQLKKKRISSDVFSSSEVPNDAPSWAVNTTYQHQSINQVQEQLR